MSLDNYPSLRATLTPEQRLILLEEEVAALAKRQSDLEQQVYHPLERPKQRIKAWAGGVLALMSLILGLYFGYQSLKKITIDLTAPKTVQGE